MHVDVLTPRQERILASACASAGITNSAIVAAEDVSARTALRELQTLVERGLLNLTDDEIERLKQDGVV